MEVKQLKRRNKSMSKRIINITSISIGVTWVILCIIGFFYTLSHWQNFVYLPVLFAVFGVPGMLLVLQGVLSMREVKELCKPYIDKER